MINSKWLQAVGSVALGLVCIAASAQVTVSDGGTPSYGRPIAVPPGVAGMAPKLSLGYSGGGSNGPVGYGWSLQGVSMISRCPATVAIDGAANRSPVKFVANDKLCLDGQRLIRTDPSGNPTAEQTNDAGGLPASGMQEYRTEKDSFARIRAYGMAVANDTSAGPAYFKVWTKSGQIYEYGAPLGTETDPYNGLVTNKLRVTATQDRVAGMVWAVSRISDTLGNSIAFRYEKRYKAWGTGGTLAAPTEGREWNIKEIQYSGNKVVFGYDVDANDNDLRPDRAEAYQQGFKNISLRRLKSITTYINSPNTDTLGPASNAVAVSTVKLFYEQGPRTNRSRVIKIQDCAGAPDSTRCLPVTNFAYSLGTPPGLVDATNLTADLKTLNLSSQDGKYGVLVGDFNGDGLSDIVRWSENAGGENQLWLSNGDGTFRSTSFSITEVLMKANGCYYTMVVDTNGDGLADLVRIPSTVANDGSTSCGVPMQAEYFINRGSGQFTRNVLSIGLTPIVFDRKTSKATTTRYCNAVPIDGSQAACQNPRYGVSWPSGATFYFVDANGDGKLDLVTSTVAERPAQDPGYPSVPDPDLLTAFLECTGCTRVYLATDGEGQFQERLTHPMKDTTVYADPGKGGDLQSLRRVVDQNGDGLADLVGVGTPYKKASWLSNGTGDFNAIASAWSCDVPLDFNGDGRTDCLQTSPDASTNRLTVSDGSDSNRLVPGFNLMDAGEELSSEGKKIPGQNFGTVILDVDGDGRQDILRWHDDPSLNRYYRSLGDGTFADASTPTGPDLMSAFIGIQFRKSNGKFDFIVGDFTGRGVLEVLRVSQDAPTSNGDATKENKLYLTSVQGQGVPAAPDQLIQVISGTGSSTLLKYATLSNSASSSSTDQRYASDRQTPYAASGTTVDLNLPLWVVTTTEFDSGLGAPGSTRLTSELSYVGLKANTEGRGLLGFREVRRQASARNGQPLTAITNYLQTHPYIGAALSSTTRAGTVNQTTAPVISSAVTVYCDKTAAAGADATALVSGLPCPTTAKVQRPYLLRTTETGFDPPGANGNQGPALPTVVTVNSYNDTGDPTKIVVTTTGSSAGLMQTSTKETTNLYFAEDTSCSSDGTTCNWVLGRLDKASVLNTVPDLLASITTDYGTGAHASQTVGTGPLPAGWVISVTTNTASALVATQGGASVTGTITFTNTGTKATTLTMSGLSGPYSVTPTECTVQPSGGTCTVTVTMTTGGAVGSQGSQTLLASCCGSVAATATVSGTLNSGGTTVFLDFEGALTGPSPSPITDFYNTAPQNYGVVFSGDAVVVDGSELEYSPPHGATVLMSAYTGHSTSVTMTVTNGFAGQLTFKVASTQSVQFTIRGANGELLKSGDISPPTGGLWQTRTIPFTGLAYTLTVEDTLGQGYAIDGISLLRP